MDQTYFQYLDTITFLRSQPNRKQIFNDIILLLKEIVIREGSNNYMAILF